MTDAQREALTKLCERYNVEFHEDDYVPRFDLPEGWLAGWVGGQSHSLYDHSDVNVVRWGANPTIYVGVSPEGETHS